MMVWAEDTPEHVKNKASSSCYNCGWPLTIKKIRTDVDLTLCSGCQNMIVPIDPKPKKKKKKKAFIPSWDGQGRGWPDGLNQQSKKKRKTGYTPPRKEILLEQQEGRCHYCKDPLEIEDATWDHVIPKSKGGKRGSNLVVACKRCNSAKGDMPISEFTSTKTEV